MRHKIFLGVLALMLFAPVQARAVETFLLTDMHLRAGPYQNYPVLMKLREGTRVEMNGCLRNHKWCEVEAGKMHGWMRSKHLALVQNGRTLRIEPYAEILRVRTLAFDERTYWARFYPHSDFYVSEYVRHDNWRKRNSWKSKCYDPGRDGDCHLQVFNHGVQAQPQPQPVMTRSVVSRYAEADDDHTRHDYNRTSGSPVFLKGYATYDKSTAKYNN
ncbi:MAG: SH3 domain-containing protein [Alphaproteobacteria bacterium]